SPRTRALTMESSGIIHPFLNGLQNGVPQPESTNHSPCLASYQSHIAAVLRSRFDAALILPILYL
ncbi:hypothetical protein, partial [Pseudorhizobium pelagicum]|uniref:hypothetical protein n=1 Tax=Pseudorhizobium pelagicum TaxID=1509405 RepID=UPI001AEBC0E7